jgi:hypothetical protein
MTTKFLSEVQGKKSYGRPSIRQKIVGATVIKIRFEVAARIKFTRNTIKW